MEINFSCGSIMNRCSKLLRYVNKIPNASIGRISQAEPKKLASVVKPKTRRSRLAFFPTQPYCHIALLPSR